MSSCLTNSHNLEKSRDKTHTFGLIFNIKHVLRTRTGCAGIRETTYYNKISVTKNEKMKMPASGLHIRICLFTYLCIFIYILLCFYVFIYLLLIYLLIYYLFIYLHDETWKSISLNRPTQKLGSTVYSHVHVIKTQKFRNCVRHHVNIQTSFVYVPYDSRQSHSDRLYFHNDKKRWAVSKMFHFNDTTSSDSDTRHKSARETVWNGYVTCVGNYQPGVAANALSLQSGGARFKCKAEYQLSWQIFRRFPHPPQANSWRVHHLRHNHFFQIITNSSFTIQSTVFSDTV
jgi:hypothetical protein